MRLAESSNDFSVSDYPLLGVIRNLCEERKTGRLQITNPQAHGSIYFKDGEVVDAELGTESGAEAVYQALAVPDASFIFDAHIQPTRRTINESWQWITFQGMQYLKKRAASNATATARSDEPTSRFSPSAAPRVDKAPLVTDQAAEGALRAGVPPPRGKLLLAAASDILTALLPKLNRAAIYLKRQIFAACALFYRAATSESGKKALASARNKSTSLIATLNPVRFRFIRQILIAIIIGGLVIGPSALVLIGRFGEKEAPPADALLPEEEEEDTAGFEVAPKRKRSIRQSDRRRSTYGRSGAEASRTYAAKRNDSPAASPAIVSSSPVKAVENPVAAKSQEIASSGAQTVTVVMQIENGRVSQAYVPNSRPDMKTYEASALQIARQRRYPAGIKGKQTMQIKVNRPLN